MDCMLKCCVYMPSSMSSFLFFLTGLPSDATHFSHTHTQSYVHTVLCTDCERVLISGGNVLLTMLFNTLTSLPHTSWSDWSRRNAVWADRVESKSCRFASWRTFSTPQTILRIVSQLPQNFWYSSVFIYMLKVCDQSQNSRFVTNHVNVVLPRCPPLQVIATIPPWSGE